MNTCMEHMHHVNFGEKIFIAVQFSSFPKDIDVFIRVSIKLYSLSVKCVSYFAISSKLLPPQGISISTTIRVLKLNGFCLVSHIIWKIKLLNVPYCLTLTYCQEIMLKLIQAIRNWIKYHFSFDSIQLFQRNIKKCYRHCMLFGIIPEILSRIHKEKNTESNIF